MNIKLTVTFVILILLTAFFFGCTSSPSSENNWDNIVSSYDRSDNEFEGYEGKVQIQDEVKLVEYVPSADKTKFILKSNSIPLYVDGGDVPEVDKKHSDLDGKFNQGDEIVINIHIHQDDIGREYIEEMDMYA